MPVADRLAAANARREDAAQRELFVLGIRHRTALELLRQNAETLAEHADRVPSVVLKQSEIGLAFVEAFDREQQAS